MNLRLPGQYYDAETETHYNYFRDYNPKTGRYQQSDPIGLLGGVNHYGYVGGNPILYFDTQGLFLSRVNGWITSDGFVNFMAGWGDGVIGGMSFGFIDGAELRKRWDIGNVELCAPEYNVGHVIGVITPYALEYKHGGEIRWLGNKKKRIAPFGNRTGHPIGKYPHYHRAKPDPKKPGQSLRDQGADRHRP